MNTRRKFGEVREDGYRFRGYQKGAHGLLEQWVSPEVWERRRKYQAEWTSRRKKAVRADPDLLATQRAYAAAHMRRVRQEKPKQQMLIRARVRAREKDIACAITETDFEIPKRCPVLGIVLQVGTGRPGDGSPELDRIDVRKGYVPGNIMVISRKANSMKRDATLAELRRFARFYLEFKAPRATPRRVP